MFGKGAKSVKERKDSLSTNGAGPTDYPQAIYPCAKLHTLWKTYPKEITEIYVKCKTTELRIKTWRKIFGT